MSSPPQTTLTVNLTLSTRRAQFEALDEIKAAVLTGKQDDR